jgi:sugar phosphate isomerase/epimerase
MPDGLPFIPDHISVNMPPLNRSLMKSKTQNLSRRGFLTVSGAAASIIAAHTTTGTALAALAADKTTPPASPGKTMKKLSIGLELYAVRTELSRDLPNTLRTVAGMGYEAVEFYAPYVNWTIPYAKEVRTMMEDCGLRCYSTHNSMESFLPGESMAKAIELNQILGTRHLILASAPGGTQGLDGWKKLSDQLTQAMEQLKPHGLSAGFHNHQAEWAKIDGNLRIMDVLAANTPKDFVLQFDVGTCMEAGQDPIAWINANPGRIKVVHLKDWAPGKDADEKGYRVLFGEGISPWKEIIQALETTGGVEVYLMEQEGSRYSEFESAQRCLAAWKALRAKIS